MKTLHPDIGDDADSDKDDDAIGEPTYNNGNILTTTYVLIYSQLQSLGKELWNQDFFTALIKNANSPLDNIISCKLFPMNIDKHNSQQLIIGNVDMKQLAYVATNKQVFSSESFVFNEIFTKRKFLNYEPYLKLQLYLPFIGNVNISPQEVIGNRIQIKWIVDFVTGALETAVCVNGKQRFTYNSQCGVDIPLSSSNRTLIEANSIKNAVFATLSKNPVGALSSVTEFASGLLGNESTSQNGTPSPSTALCTEMGAYFTIERVNYSESEGYAKTYGEPLNEWWQLGFLKGYTVCDNPKLDSVICTEEEKDRIKTLLESGVYL